MSKILLIGAGFSRNWGGLLANEVRSHLVSKLEKHSFLINLLHRSSGFESAFEELRLSYENNPSKENFDNIECFQDALRSVFKNMNQAFFKRGQMNFSQDRTFSIVKFLSQFDAIFSLNQDLLLELLYVEHIALEAPGRWNGFYFPGLQPNANWRSDILNSQWFVNNNFEIQPYLQPIYKLHGSINWFEPQGSGLNPLMVIGENKLNKIAGQEVLRFNNGQFFKTLIEPSTKLMVIGYGFKDAHINKFITDAYELNKFSLHLMHPEGREYLKKINKTVNAIYVPEPIEQIPMIDYIRQISEIFAGDEIELGRLNEFFNN